MCENSLLVVLHGRIVSHLNVTGVLSIYLLKFVIVGIELS
jgi:hypothetical protein